MKRSILILISALLVLTNASAQQSIYDEIMADLNKAGGVYLAYPVTESANTPAPKGYKPFYVSHYGRHGSRYLISDKDYTEISNLLHLAKEKNALTPLGMDLLAKVDSITEEGRGRGGELTPLGSRQHHDIAQRMARAYPEVFNGNPEVTAASTTVMRCAHSMFAFIEGLKEIYPNIKIPRESSPRHMYFLNYHSPESAPYSSEQGEWYQDFKKFKADKTRPERLVPTIFSDSTFIRRHVDPTDFMTALYWIAVDVQNMETDIDLLYLFTPDELFNLWELYNFNFYACNSSYPLADGQHVDNAKNLLRNIVETADEYIENGKNGATLRFGHDGNIIPLAALLQIEGADAYEANPYELHKVYANYRVSPMASNVQLVFFKNKNGDVIVKLMLNEKEVALPADTDMFPFYRWEDARAALQHIIDTPSREFIPQESIR